MNNETYDLFKEFKIEEKLKNIWTKYYKNNDCISPIYQETVLRNVVTFLSLNPSLKRKDKISLKTNEMKIIHYPMIDFENKSPNPHYNKFFEIGNIIKQPWTATELLYIRNSIQKTVENEDTEFVIEQMKITFDILYNINPKIVIVANSFVDKLIHNYSKELDLKIEQPCKSNGNIYFINTIPFIIKESRFMGSRILWAKDNDRKENLYKEINRILKIDLKN